MVGGSGVGEDGDAVNLVILEQLSDVDLPCLQWRSQRQPEASIFLLSEKEQLVALTYLLSGVIGRVLSPLSFYQHCFHLYSQLPLSPQPKTKQHPHRPNPDRESLKASPSPSPAAYNYNSLMSDNFRVVECLHTPSPLFAIYDYTKLAYLAGHYLCLREVVNPDARPSFIPLENPASASRYFGIAAFPNCLVLAEQSHSKDVLLHFYQQEESHLRYVSELSRRSDPETPVTMQLHHSNRFIYIVVRREMDLEVVVVELASKLLLGRAFLNGDAGEFRVKTVEHLELFSVGLKDVGQIVELEVIAGKPEEGVRMVEKGRWGMGNADALHCWVKDELVLFHSDTAFVYLQGKLLQTIPVLKGFKVLEATISGFLLAGSSRLHFFKKNNNSFQVSAEYEVEEQPSRRVLLSPQQDMLAFYSTKRQAIFYACNFDNHEQLDRKGKLPLECVQHESRKIKTFNSPQTLLVITSENTLNIYSPITFHCYITVRIDSKEPRNNESQNQRRLQRSTTMMPERVSLKVEEGETLETVGIHPVSSVIGVAFRNTVRVYQVLYNQLRVVREILISHCRQVGFNRSGSIMYAKVSGKQGSKIYLFNTLNNYEHLEVLSSNRPIDCVRFSHLDHIVYGVHAQGYYFWSLESLFKQRGEQSDIGFKIRGAEIYLNNLLLWGENDLLLIDQSGTRQAIKLASPISNLLVQQNSFILSTAAGELFRCKGVPAINPALAMPGFRIFQGSQLFAVRANNVILCLSQDGNILCVEWGNEEKNSHQLIAIERRRIVKYQEKYHQYQDHMCDLQEKLGQQLELLQEEFSRRQQQQRQQFVRQLADREDRYLLMRAEKLKLEESMEENLQAHQHETVQQVKELQRMYERKIALTTNKLLTSEEMGFRNQLLARQNLQTLEQKHCEDIRDIRHEYGRQLGRQLQAGDKKDELFTIKREYETRLSQLEQENQNLLKRFQTMTENNIVNLKKNVVTLELKYSEEVSQKVNLQKEFQDKLVDFEVLRAKNEYLQERLGEQIRRGEQLSREYSRVQGLTVEKDQAIACLERRVLELEKSNEIFKYRIIEMKSVSDPKEEEILKLKDNMIELEEEYEKITKKAHQYEQNIALLKKDVIQTRNSLTTALQKERKLDKNYAAVIDKIREATKAPIQEIRKMLIKVLEQFEHPAEGKALEQKRSNSPLGELNRVREHLEVCLMEVVETGKKNEKHKNVQISRKNRENSQLLRQINDLRVRVRELEGILKDKELQLQQFTREGRATSSFKVARGGYDRASTNFDSESRQLVKNRTKQSFFEKSMFKGYWREKRLKTEQGSRKKSAHSLMKQETNNLYIESKGEEVEELRRLLDQKETIIKQLINKIHKLS